MSQENLNVKLLWAALVLAGLGLSMVILMLMFKAQEPAVLLPANLERLDPEVVSLIQRHAKQIETRPNDAEGYGNLCLVFEANTLWEDARSCFATVSLLAPKQMLWRYHLAIATRQTGSSQEALDKLLILADDYPSFAPLQQRLGETLLEVGDLDHAEIAFRRLIDISPKTSDGYTGLGAVLLGRNDYAGATQLLEKSARLDPGYPLTRYRLGMAYRGLGRQEQALRELAKGVDARARTLPDSFTAKIESYAVNLTAQQNKAASLLQRGKPGDAATVLERVLTFHPENVTVLNNLAIAYMRQGQFDRSRTMLSRALEINDAKFSTHLNLTFLALRRGELETALKHIDTAVERAPTVAQTHFTRARVLANLGRYDDALVSLDSALALDGTDPQIHTFIADLSLHLKRPEQAETHYREAIGLQPEFLPAQLGLGNVYLQQGRLEDAKVILDVARTIAPKHPQVSALEKQLEAAGK